MGQLVRQHGLERRSQRRCRIDGDPDLSVEDSGDPVGNRDERKKRTPGVEDDDLWGRGDGSEHRVRTGVLGGQMIPDPPQQILPNSSVGDDREAAGLEGARPTHHRELRAGGFERTRKGGSWAAQTAAAFPRRHRVV